MRDWSLDDNLVTQKYGWMISQTQDGVHVLTGVGSSLWGAKQETLLKLVESRLDTCEYSRRAFALLSYQKLIGRTK